MKRWGFTITLTCGVLLACCAAQAQLDQILNKLDTHVCSNPTTCQEWR